MRSPVRAFGAASLLLGALAAPPALAQQQQQSPLSRMPSSTTPDTSASPTGAALPGPSLGGPPSVSPPIVTSPVPGGNGGRIDLERAPDGSITNQVQGLTGRDSTGVVQPKTP